MEAAWEVGGGWCGVEQGPCIPGAVACGVSRLSPLASALLLPETLSLLQLWAEQASLGKGPCLRGRP